MLFAPDRLLDDLGGSWQDVAWSVTVMNARIDNRPAVLDSGEIRATGDPARALFWAKLATVMATAVAVRLLLFRGMFPSDDAVYFARALTIANGIWDSSNYIGAIRYGVNIPIAGAITLFGPNLIAAALVPLACSLGEIVLVATLVRLAWGDQTAVYAAALLSFVPSHIQLATSIHPDPILAFTITLCFVLFWRAERNGNSWAYFSAGLAAGYAYWVKEASIIFLGSFLLYVVVVRRWSTAWLWCVGGAVIAFAANSALMWEISGSAFHNLEVMRLQTSTAWISESVIDSPFFYLWELFVDIRHTWLLGYLALIGAVCLVRGRHEMGPQDRAFRVYVAVWALGLLVAFSLVPVSLSPLRFVMKQTNYMTIFFASLTIISAFGITQMRRWVRGLTIGVFALGGFTLAALAQQDERAFIGNAQAAEAYAISHPNNVVYGTEWIFNTAIFHSKLRSVSSTPNIQPLRELRALPDIRPDQKVITVIDRETLGRSPRDIALPKIPPCWVPIGTLQPIGYGIGADVTRAIVWTTRWLPFGLGHRVSGRFERLLHPKPAELYSVPPAFPWCN